MKKQRNKIIALLLSILLIASIFVIGTVANTKNVTLSLNINKENMGIGESATVTVTATAEFPVATFSIPVFYDKTKVEVSEFVTEMSESYAKINTTTDLDAVDAERIYTNTNIDKNIYGFILVNYIAAANATVPQELNNQVVLTFTITAKENVSGAAVVKCVEESIKTEENIAGMLYFGAANSNTIDSIPENIEDVNVLNAEANVLIGNTVALKVGAPYEAVIDTTNVPEGYNGVIYGIDTLGWNDDFKVDGKISDFITTVNGDEYLQVVVGDSGVETTGTLINILDENKNVVETYVFVYFGDVDMDGTVTTSDSAFCDFYEAEYTGIDTMYQFMAADLDGDGWPTTSDSAFMDFYEAEYSGMPYQTDVSAVAKDVIYEMI